eukprot:CAMPEP_0175949062 /NCGR_PEP_ID=MMETSP0108-20121206/28813_1 /TAXON_ID=195067 ORGANISM="Goniomonas pacifica, Strain CCMP1869" /NCGR_SAMPLE_ID=MMETSP0108 /ASSEMBLY_ACC=CAM_ASM_000204 /LENGTH=36 /DNA_ID= /DNA_START= /DNA_END= /DNA_ORIENTATION=
MTHDRKQPQVGTKSSDRIVERLPPRWAIDSSMSVSE